MSLPKSYRPVIMSVIFSKILEYYILDKTSHTYNKYKFGFISKRSTNMATSLVHDVTAYCNAAGSPVYLCSLDAEGAFDGILHGVLLSCADGILPDMCLRVLYNWYASMYVNIKWNNEHINRVDVKRVLAKEVVNQYIGDRPSDNDQYCSELCQ